VRAQVQSLGGPPAQLLAAVDADLTQWVLLPPAAQSQAGHRPSSLVGTQNVLIKLQQRLGGGGGRGAATGQEKMAQKLEGLTRTLIKALELQQQQQQQQQQY
jgi:hypothetical protein